MQILLIFGSNSYVSSKINKTVIKNQFFSIRSNVISVKVGRSVNLLFIFIYIEKTNEVPAKKSGFATFDNIH